MVAVVAMMAMVAVVAVPGGSGCGRYRQQRRAGKDNE
jgi:hypothetical protein